MSITNLVYCFTGMLSSSFTLHGVCTSSRHYDIIAASTIGWESDPFKLTGHNGYLYGRGATDNKGPIMAVAFAAAELLSRKALGLDLVLLIEGEEESGSGGFEDAVLNHKVSC